jgi:hypothetical protein
MAEKKSEELPLPRFLQFLQGHAMACPYFKNMQSTRLFSFNSVKFALVNKVEACAAFVKNHLL